MAGFRNDTVYADNVDFTGNSSVSPKILNDGELLIGSSVAPNIRVGTIVSTDSYVTITNNSGQIDITQGTAGGDVVGPASSTDNAIARWDGTTGKLLQNSTPTIDNNGSTTASVNIAGALFNNLTNATGDCKWELVSASDSWGVMIPQGSASTGWHFGLDNSDTDAYIFGEGNSFASAGTTFYRVNHSGIFEHKKGVAYNHRSIAVSDNIELDDYIVGVTDNSSARTLTLPSGASVGQSFTVKDQAGTAGSANAITIDTAGAELIDGAATATINSNYGALRFYFDGTNYFIY